MKRKFLILAPVIALVLSGCTLFGTKKSSKKKKSSSVTTSLTSNTSDSSSTKSTSGTTGTSGGDVETPIGSIDNPISVTEFRTYLDQYIDYSKIDSGKSEMDKDHIYFVKAMVSGNDAIDSSSHDIKFLDLYEKGNASLTITGRFVLIDSSVTGDYSAKNSLVGYEVIVKGYGQLYNNPKSGKDYQLDKKDNSHKTTIMSATPGTPGPALDYGTLDDPLTITEAINVINQESPTAQTMYVTGKISKNAAYNTQYKNTNIWITDGTNEFELYGCSLPSGFTPAQPVENDPALVGKDVVASGTGKVYQSTFELDKGCVINKITMDDPESVVITSGDKVGVNGTLSLTANVLPATASQEVTWSIAEGTAATVSGSTLTAGATAGSVTVRATATGTNVHADKVITITDEAIPVTGVSLDASELTVGIGKTKTLVATIAPETATDKVVTWSSDHENIATVANGVVTGVAVGTATITVTTHDGGHTDTCEVTVSESEEHTLTWTASKAADLGDKIAAAGGTATGTISTGEFSWSYTRTLVALADNKADNIQFMGGTWIQLGSNNALESVSFETSAISGTIKSVTVVVATAGTHTLTVDVGGTKYLNGEALQTYSGQASATNPDPANCAKTGTGTSSGAITITVAQSDTGTKKAMLIRSIEVVAVY